MSFEIAGFLECGMGKRPQAQFRSLYLGDWIESMGYRQADVCKATGISQGYISNLSGGRKGNPSANILLRISEFIGITINDFYLPPPPDDALTQLGRYSPVAREGLMRRGRKQA